MAKHNEDLRDVNFIAEDLLRFAAMTFDELRTHWKEHPEDRLHHVNMAGGGHYPISREAAHCFEQLARRQRDIDPDKHSIDLLALDRLIRSAFMKIFLVDGRPIERKWVDRMLNRVIREAKMDHEAVTHYFPCVITRREQPVEFRIGPVRFISTNKFFADFQGKIEADHKAANERCKEKLEQMITEGKYTIQQKMSEEESARIEQIMLDRMYEYYKGFVWIAEVAVPPCNTTVSHERAEITVQATLDVLKLFFGPSGGKDLRLAHDRGRTDRTVHLTCGSDTEFQFSIGIHSEGALLEAGWYKHLVEQLGWAVKAAGSAIEGYLKPGIESDHRDRWLGALNWYGQAVSESLPSAQLVKYVAALERLTVTNETRTNEITDVVTRRTALLSVESYDAAVLSEALENARKLYRWRSNLMHGRSSPLTKEFLSVMHLAHQSVQQVLFSTLALYAGLEMAGKRTSKDLDECFVEMEKELSIEATKAKSTDPNAIRLSNAAYELKAAEKKIKSNTAREHIRRAIALVNEVQQRLKQ